MGGTRTDALAAPPREPATAKLSGDDRDPSAGEAARDVDRPGINAGLSGLPPRAAAGVRKDDAAPASPAAGGAAASATGAAKARSGPPASPGGRPAGWPAAQLGHVLSARVLAS